MMTRSLLTLLAFALFIAVQLRAQDQFVPLNGPYTGDPTLLEAAPNGTLLLFSDYHHRLFRSTDRGRTWGVLRNGLPSGVAGTIHAASDGTLYLVMVSPQGLYRSTDNGDSWKELTPPAGSHQEFQTLSSGAGGALYLLMGERDDAQAGQYRSTDRGESWAPLGSTPGELRSLVEAPDGALLAVRGNYYGGESIDRSTDRGATWSSVLRAEEREKFLEVFAGPQGDAWAIADDGYRSVPYHSADNGTSWRRGRQLPFSYVRGAVQAPDGALLIGLELAPSTIYRYSVEGGIESVEELSSGMHGTEYGYSPIAIAPDGSIYGGFGGFLLRSSDNGVRWELTGATSGTFRPVALGRDERVYVGVQNGGIMRSTDRGESWSLASDGILGNYNVVDLAADGAGRLFAATSGGAGLYRSDDDGTLWRPIAPGGVSAVTMIFIASNGDLYIGGGDGSAEGRRLYRSADGGTTWNMLPSSVAERTEALRMMERGNGSLYLLGRTELYKSSDRGGSWTILKTFAPASPGPSVLICGNGDLLLSDAAKLHRSVDDGATWTEEPEIPGDRYFFEGAFLVGIAPAGQIWLGTVNRKLQISYDAGTTWQPGAPVDAVRDIAFAPSGDIYLTAERQVYRGRDMGVWSRTAQSSGRQVLALDALANGTIFVSTFNSGISLSRNNGDQWFGRGIPMPQYAYSLLAASEDSILAGTSIGIFRTTDGGITWKHVSNAIPQTFFIHGLIRDPAGMVYVGTFGGGVYRSTNGAGGWVARNNGLANLYVKGLSLGTDGHLFAATNGGIYGSTDGGESWTSANGNLPDGFYANAVLYRQGAYLLAGTKGGIYRSADQGEHWEHVSSIIDAKAEIRALYADERGVIWAGCDAGIFSSTDGGRTWQPSGLGDKDVRAFTENSSYLFAGTTSDGVYRMARAVASAGEHAWEKVAGSTLQALPNPSGGKVTFRFTIPDAGHALLELYDRRGARVATLIDAEMPAGEHLLGWESDLPSGTYYCTLTEGGRRTLLEVLLLGGNGR